MILDPYQDKAGEWRWREKDPSKPEGDPDHIVASSNDGFATKAEAIRQGEAATGLKYQTKPYLAITSQNAPWENKPWHAYRTLDGKTPDGSEGQFGLLTNVDAWTTKDPQKHNGPQRWTEIVAGGWDAHLDEVAKKGRIVSLFHENGSFQGTPQSYVAAFDYVYDYLHAANPNILVGPCYFGDWATGKKRADLKSLWRPRRADFLGCDPYPGRSSKTFDELMVDWLSLAREWDLPLGVCETAAPAGYATQFYASIALSANLADYLFIALWLSKGDREDYRPSVLTASDMSALNSLSKSTSFDTNP